MDRLIELLEKAFAPWLKPLWESTAFWRAATLILALSIAAAIKYREKLVKWWDRKDFDGHDSRIFETADGIMTEVKLRNTLSNLRSDHSYYASSIHSLDKFAEYFTFTSNRFINRDLQFKADAVVAAFEDLRNFIAKWFFRFPQDQRDMDDGRYCLFPRGNPDREGMGEPDKERQYTALTNQLRKLLAAAESAYDEYRGAVKKRLRK